MVIYGNIAFLKMFSTTTVERAQKMKLKKQKPCSGVNSTARKQTKKKRVM